MKILVATEKPFAKQAVENMRKEAENANFEFILLEKYSSKAELIDIISTVDALIVRSDKIDKEILSAAKNLKIVVRAGAGYDNIDLNAATELEICVMNTPGQNANAVAELVFGLLISHIRNNYNGTSGTELKDKTIGIHAYGNIGKNVARVAKGFGMRVVAYDIHNNITKLKTDNVELIKTEEELYSISDFLSINIPLTPQTDKSINNKLLSLLPSNAIVINTARKEVIDEEDMLNHLIKNRDTAYITDIKPNRADEFIEKCGKQYFATPKKMGAQTEEANTNSGIAAVKQIIDYINCGNEKFRVNKKTE